MSTARFIIGETLDVLRSMPDASVDLVLTSPPFLALRSYLPADHPDKHRERGGEGTPGAYIDGLLDIVEESRRVLAPHGTLALELGDSYSGSGGSGGDYLPGGLREDQAKFTGTAARSGRGRTVSLDADRYASSDTRPGWPLAKSLCLVPELLRVALAYGVNPLTGRTTEPWRVRNVVRWCRPNPPVGALGDKFRPATSDLLIACVGRERYFDLDAVRTPLTEPDADQRFVGKVNQREQARVDVGLSSGRGFTAQNANGAPPLDYWEIPTQPYAGSHYATWPKRLCERPILAMSPQRVCATCGKPSRRLVQKSADYADHMEKREGRNLAPVGERLNRLDTDHAARKDASYETVGWSDCGHGTWRRGVVLDVFAGSGTTLEVATGLGRDAIGIDLDERNISLAERRVGMFLQVEHHAAAESA